MQVVFDKIPIDDCWSTRVINSDGRRCPLPYTVMHGTTTHEWSRVCQSFRRGDVKL